MKTIVAGSRTNVTLDDVRHAMAKAPFTITEVVSGTARGVDQFGEIIAIELDLPITQFPAQWSDLTAKPCKVKQNQYGKYNCLAGHNRNTEMSHYADALIAICPKKITPGTKNMIERMKRIGKEIFVYIIDHP